MRNELVSGPQWSGARERTVVEVMVSYVHIQGRRFGPLADLASVRQRIQSAVISGGDFVSLPVAGRTLDVLVTGRMHLRFETVDVDEDAPTGGSIGVGSLVLDEDHFDEWGL